MQSKVDSHKGVERVLKMQTRDLTGYVVKMPDLKGRLWFHGIARERIREDVYRFEVIQLAGRLVDAEIIASFEELAEASVATVA
jgi:hypothetical protein